MSIVGSPRPRGSESDALALRVAELSSVLKQQRDELDEQKTLLEHNRNVVRDHEEIIRMQEGQLIERDAQLQAQNAEIRALKRQHVMDAEALRACQLQLQSRLRPSGAMGTPIAAQQLKNERSRTLSVSVASPSRRGHAGDASPRSPQSSSSRFTPGDVTRKQLQQAIADKVVLVRALHQLTAEMAEARAEARQYAAVSERSLSTAWRLGQLGQLGLALLESGDGGAADDSNIEAEQEIEIDADRWEALMNATASSPPRGDRLLPPVLPPVVPVYGVQVDEDDECVV